MDILKQLNNAIAYIEAHLCDEINTDELSRIALYPLDSFNRFFSYMVGMTLNEYIRKRRLTLAAYEIRNSNIRIIDIAVKYGYNSADAFTKAFIKQHGITPTAAKISSAVLKVYPPVSFHIIIKGAKQMEFKIFDTGEIALKGLSKQFTGSAADRFEQEHIMWANHHDDIQNKVCNYIPGIWYGIWDNGKYSIAKHSDEINNNNLEDILIPSGKYAVFSSGFGAFAGDVLPKLRGQIFDAWLADSGYTQTSDYEIEVYYLYEGAEKHKRHYELWLPVKKL